jgi:hypothetical protein
LLLLNLPCVTVRFQYHQVATFCPLEERIAAPARYKWLGAPCLVTVTTWTGAYALPGGAVPLFRGYQRVALAQEERGAFYYRTGTNNTTKRKTEREEHPEDLLLSFRQALAFAGALSCYRGI